MAFHDFDFFVRETIKLIDQTGIASSVAAIWRSSAMRFCGARAAANCGATPASTPQASPAGRAGLCHASSASEANRILLVKLQSAIRKFH